MDSVLNIRNKPVLGKLKRCSQFMFGSDSSGPTPRKLALVLFATTVMIGGLFASGVYQEARYSEIATERSRTYAALINSDVQRSCSFLSSAKERLCVFQEAAEAQQKKRDNERNEAELVAQRKSALWTGIMGLAALIGMGLSTIGVWLVWTTFRETKRTADVAHNQLALAQTATLADLRPWIQIDLRVIRFKAASRSLEFDFELRFTNIGQAVAERVQSRARSLWLGEGLSDPIDKAFADMAWDKRQSRLALMPGEQLKNMHSSMCARDHIPWHGPEGQRVATFVVAASVKYWSSLDNEWHRTDRSFTIGMEGDHFFHSRYMPESASGEVFAEQIDCALVISSFRAGETS